MPGISRLCRINLIIAALLSGFLILLSGCSSSISSNHVSSYPEPKILAPTLTSDVEVGKKVKGNAHRTIILGLLEIGDNDYISGAVEESAQDSAYNFVPLPFSDDNNPAQKAKHAAAYNALENTDGNVLIAPVYKLKERNFLLFKTYAAEVDGWSGKIENIRQIKNYSTDNSETVPEYHLINALKENHKNSEVILKTGDQGTLRITKATPVYHGDKVIANLGIGDKVELKKSESEYLYIRFTNESGEKEEGWIAVNDIDQDGES